MLPNAAIAYFTDVQSPTSKCFQVRNSPKRNGWIGAKKLFNAAVVLFILQEWRSLTNNWVPIAVLNFDGEL